MAASLGETIARARRLRSVPRSQSPLMAGPALSGPAVRIAVLLAVVLRLPAIGRAPGLDEAGFLMVARQWAHGGSSLYGSYWVDRPPLLLTIFRFAALHGGLITLRLLGCLAAAATVVGVAHCAGRLGAGAGVAPAASAWSAFAAAAWLVNPLAGSSEVNGELLAAPIVVWGLAAVIAALDVSGARGRARVNAVAAGAAAVAALLVKQNFADVAVCFTLAVILAVARRELSLAAASTLGTWFAGGAAVAAAVAAGWVVLHGTSVSGVLWAMYPFRVVAGQEIAASGNPAATVRLGHLTLAWALSGLGPVAAAVLWRVVRGWRSQQSVVLALVGLLGFDVLSILSGGSFWSHYLVQLVVPVSILFGVVAARSAPSVRYLAVPLVVAASLSMLASGALRPGSGTSEGATLGRAVAAAAQPDDTIVTLYGHSDVTETSGMASPYLYLWSLPLKTLDPDLTRLDQVLSGPSAPTWVVTWARLSSWGVHPQEVARTLAKEYHVAAVLHGHTVYLRNDVLRSSPTWRARNS